MAIFAVSCFICAAQSGDRAKPTNLKTNPLERAAGAMTLSKDSVPMRPLDGRRHSGEAPRIERQRPLENQRKSGLFRGDKGE